MRDLNPIAVLHAETARLRTMHPPDSVNPESSGRPPASAAETDEQLMAEFARGRTDAFDTLFKRYRQPLFGFFRRRLEDAAAAEELTQETFLAVLKGSSRYQATALFRTYLYAIGFNLLRAHRRRGWIVGRWRGEAPPHFEPAMPGDLGSDAMLRHAVGQLDKLDREMLLLREFEQLSYLEIATLLAVPVNTVRSRLFRARMALRDLLAARAGSSTTNQPSGTEGRS